jgi:plastocyanin
MGGHAMKIRTWITVLGIGALVAVSLVGCGGSSNKSTNPPTPKELDSGTISGSFAHTFATAGTFPYHCNFHRNMGMTGTVTVSNAAPAGDQGVAAAGTSFNPPNITVRTGNKVTWTSTGTHTVTSD